MVLFFFDILHIKLWDFCLKPRSQIVIFQISSKDLLCGLRQVVKPLWFQIHLSLKWGQWQWSVRDKVSIKVLLQEWLLICFTVISINHKTVTCFVKFLCTHISLLDISPRWVKWHIGFVLCLYSLSSLVSFSKFSWFKSL